MKRGIPVSPGVAVARAYRLDDRSPHSPSGPLDATALANEIARFDRACVATANDLDAVAERVRTEVGPDEAEIFRSHRQLLRDMAREAPFVTKVKAIIRQKKVEATVALSMALDEYGALFAKIPDPYLREKLSDIKDVVGRVQTHLIGKDGTGQPAVWEGPVILVAAEILPSQSVMFDRIPVAGIVTESGGTTGHAAILARSLGIAAVSGLDGIRDLIRSGDLLIVDGREGIVLINPGAEVEAAYRKVMREFVDLRDRLIENADRPAITADGTALSLLANVNGPDDAVTAVRTGAGGVGLYRTEYLFLTHASVPNEAEQLAAYQLVIESSPNRWVTIRTLDVGGDKQIPFLGSHREANPFMGWRSIRMTTAYPELFQTQLRAILRAGEFGHVSVMFPMVTTLEEVRLIKKVVLDTQTQLGLPHNTPFGVMIEVPAAALCVGDILNEVDFVSIGSNDLIQYVMAADRDNPKVAHLCDPFNPAIYRLLNWVISKCTEQHKPVTLCGEMAAQPRCFLPLLGMGLRRFSMSPAFVPAIKELACCVTVSHAQEVAQAVLKLQTIAEVRDYLTDQLRNACPNVSQLDMAK